MGNPKGFLEVPKQDRGYDPVEARVKNWKEFIVPLQDDDIRRQAERCIDCGIPYCHTPPGCPVNNQIPDWNDLVYRNDWQEASVNLHSTNNFPEFTGRVCPAPCEKACTLNLMDSPVSIKSIECAIADKAFDKGWIAPEVPKARTGKTVAVIGSGPAGLACAQQLARVGHSVTVLEKQAHFGGLLWYGIPDFKMEKQIIDRRVSQMMAEGVTFRNHVNVGVNYDAERLQKYDAVVLTYGAEQQRDLEISGRELSGVHMAMEYLIQSNKRVNGEAFPEEDILATDKNVVVIGGGDTGSDCVGTAIRQGAKSVTQLTYHTTPSEKEDKLLTWPYWPMKLETTTSHEEGCDRKWSLQTQKFIGNGKVEGVELTKLQWEDVASRKFSEIPNSNFVMPADLVLLSIGFTGPVTNSVVDARNLRLERTTEETYDAYHLDSNVFYAGDIRRGASLVVWAIREGRQCAHYVDKFLMGDSELPLG